MRVLPAAAIPVGAVVRTPDNAPPGWNHLEFNIDLVENNVPVVGQITWHDNRGWAMHIGAAVPVEIVSLP